MRDRTQNIKPVGPDFCLVQLTAVGVALAAGNPLRYSNGRQQFVFDAQNTPIKVARYEWALALEPHTTPDGNALFEIYVPVPAPEICAAQGTSDSGLKQEQEEKK